MARQSIAIPDVKQYFERVPQPANTFASILEHVLVAPWYQIIRAFAGTEPVDSARITLLGESGGESSQLYDEGYYSPDTRFAMLPGLLTGATVDEDWSTLYATSGSGTSRRVYALNSPAGEETLISRASGVVVGLQADYSGTPGTGKRTVQFPGVNFNVTLAQYALPGVAATTKANPLSDAIIYVSFDSDPDRKCRVFGVHPTATDTLIVEDDLFIPADPNTGATLVRNPAYYTWFAAGRAAQRPVNTTALSASSDAGDEIITTSAGAAGTTCYNLDTVNAWEVVFVDPGANNSPLSIDIAYDPATLTGTLTINVATDNVGAVATSNTIAAINAAIAEEFRTWCRTADTPVQFYPEAGYLTSFTPADTGTVDTVDAIPAATVTWSGSVRAKSTGTAGNGYQVTLQSSGVAASNVERVGNHWIINLGTNPANCTRARINALLVAAGDLIEFNSPAGANVITVFSLGTARSHVGYHANVWGLNAQSGYLAGGLGAGGFSLEGGLVPNFEQATPNLVTLRLYAEYRALRVDRSASASMTATGNRPNLVSVTPTTYESIVGEVSTDNPMGLVCSEYFAAAGGRRVFLLGVGATATDTPWGTSADLTRTLNFLQRRDVYHVFVFNDADFVSAQMITHAESLGGTETAPLKRPQRFYIPTKNLENRPDLPLENGDAATDAGVADLILDVDVSSLSADGITAGNYVVKFTSDGDNVNGNITLQDGSKAYTITAKTVGGNPFRVTVAAAPPGGPYGAFQVIEKGASLTSGGIYLSQEAAEALYDYHDLARHARVVKHHVDEYGGLVAGVAATLDGVYLLGQFAGLIARHPSHLPVTSLTYPRVTSVVGTADIYSTEQLELLQGAGLVLPVQRGDTDAGPVYVLRDLTTDVSTRVSRRRSAGVVEDKLSIEFDRLIRPRLGPDVITPAYLDRIAMDVDSMIQRKMNSAGSREFKTLSVLSLSPITQEIRDEFGIDDSGVIVVFAYTHLEEAAQAIGRHIVTPA